VLKLLRRTAADAEANARLLREATAAATLDHEHLRDLRRRWITDAGSS
jgi:hypothetical protein